MKNLLKQWQEFIVRVPDSEYREREVRDFIRLQQRRAHGRDGHRYYWENLSAGEYLVRKYNLKQLGALIGEAIRDDDIEPVLDWLNSYDYRWVRRTLNMVEVIDNLNLGEVCSCNDCGAIEYRDNISWAYDDYPICDHCRDHNYQWSERRDTYIRDDDEEEEEFIGEYHSSSENLDHIPSKHDKHDKPIYLGLELEVEVNDSYNRGNKAEELLNAIGSHYSDIDNHHHQYALCENDGSLDHGFEIVTAWTGLDVHAKQLEFFKNAWRGVRSHDTSTCGLHIHICKSDMSLYHASKLVLFINRPDNEKLVYSLARRSSDSYAKIYDKGSDLDWIKGAKRYENKRDQLRNLNGDRYEALNFQNPDTIEFRLFKGTLKYRTIMACLEFTYASWFFTKDASQADLSTDKFLEFISLPENKANTVNLRAHLIEKGYRLPITGMIRANPRVEDKSAQLAEV